MTELDEHPTAATEGVLAAFRDGALVLPAQRPEPVVARVALEASSSETVRRHAGAFTRTWPEPERLGEEYRLPEPAPATARAIALEDLGDGKSKRVQAAKAATDGGWSWTAQHAVSPGDPEVESVVMRFRLPCGFPWESRRVVAYWRAAWKTVKGERVKPYAFVCAYSWRLYGAALVEPQTPIAAKDLAAYLREPPPIESVRRPPPRRRSKLDLSTRW